MAIAVVGTREGVQGKCQEQQFPNSALGLHHLWPNLEGTSYFQSLKVFMKLQTLSTLSEGCVPELQSSQRLLISFKWEIDESKRERSPTDQTLDLRNAAEKPDNSPECLEQGSPTPGAANWYQSVAC